MKKFEDLEVY